MAPEIATNQPRLDELWTVIVSIGSPRVRNYTIPDRKTPAPAAAGVHPVIGESKDGEVSLGVVKLTLIRHAQPAWAQSGRMVGNPVLTELGRRQAQQLADRPWEEVDEVWVSELRRARETAAPLADRLGLSPQVHSWLNEIGDPAEWDGMAIDRVEARISRLEGAASLQDLWTGVRRGEPYRSFRERVVAGLLRSLRDYGMSRLEPDQPRLWQPGRNRSILLVAHGGTNAVIHETLLGCGPAPIAWHKFRSLHTAVSTLRTYPLAHAVTFALERFGDVTHLRPEQVSE